MSADALYGIAAIHRAASFSKFATLFLGSIRTEHNIFGADPEIAQESHPKLRRAPHVQYLGYSDADSGAVLRRQRRRDGSLLCEPCLQCLETHSYSFRFQP